MATAVNKIQHWVPRFYLRHFATTESRDSDNPQIWVLPKDEREAFLTNISNVAASHYLYTPKIRDGGRDTTVDQRLTGLESFLAQFWRRVAHNHQALDERFRKVLSVFIATLFLRHPLTLQHHLRFYDAVTAALAAAPKDRLGVPMASSLVVGGMEFPLGRSDLEHYVNATEEDKRASWSYGILASVPAFAKHLMTLPWAVLFSERDVFVTSDHPVALTNGEITNPSLITPNTAIQFPISPRRLLVIGYPLDDGKIYPLREGGECDFNFLTY
jgi:hypothetical protein